MVQFFKKKSSAAELQQNQEFLNTCLAQVSIASEHCIGILKGRFRCLKRNNIKLKDSKKEVKQVADLIGACIVLHNLLLDYKEDDVPASWCEDVNYDIDWSLYNEEEEDITSVTEDTEDRRQYVFNSIMNNYLV